MNAFRLNIFPLAIAALVALASIVLTSRFFPRESIADEHRIPSTSEDSEAWHIELFLEERTASAILLRLKIQSDGQVACKTRDGAFNTVLNTDSISRIEKHLRDFQTQFLPRLPGWPQQAIYVAHARLNAKITVGRGTAISSVLLDECAGPSRAPPQLWNEATSLWDVSLDVVAETEELMRHIQAREYRLEFYTNRLRPQLLPE